MLKRVLQQLIYFSASVTCGLAIGSNASANGPYALNPTEQLEFAVAASDHVLIGDVVGAGQTPVRMPGRHYMIKRYIDVVPTQWVKGHVETGQVRILAPLHSRFPSELEDFDKRRVSVVCFGLTEKADTSSNLTLNTRWVDNLPGDGVLLLTASARDSMAMTVLAIARGQEPEALARRADAIVLAHGIDSLVFCNKPGKSCQVVSIERVIAGRSPTGNAVVAARIVKPVAAGRNVLFLGPSIGGIRDVLAYGAGIKALEHDNVRGTGMTIGEFESRVRKAYLNTHKPELPR